MLAELQAHLLDEHHGVDVHLGDDQRSLGVLWTLKVRFGRGDELQVTASRCPLPWPAAGIMIGPDELGVAEADLPASAPTDAQRLVQSSEGWPEYLAFLERSGTGAADDPAVTIERVIRTGAHVDGLVDRCLGHLGESVRESYAQLARFDRFTAAMAESLQPGTSIASARRAGLPVVDEDGGWMRLLEPIRTILSGGSSTLAYEAAGQISGDLLAAAGPIEAASMLARVGRADVGAAILREQPQHIVDDSDQARLIPLLRLLLDEAKDDGRLALMLARAHLHRSEFAEQRRYLQAARSLADDQMVRSVAVEADAELLVADVGSLSPDESTSRLAQLRDEGSEHLSRVAQIRLREIAALIDANSGRLGNVYSAVGQLEVVANEWELIGDRGRCAMTLRTLSSTCLVYLGDYRVAIRSMERACSLVRNQPGPLLRSLRLLVHLLALAGDAETFVTRFDEETRLAQWTNAPPWLDAYRSWSLMLHAAITGNAERVAQAHAEASVRLGELHGHETGALFQAESALSFALVGREAEARHALEVAEHRTELDPVDLLIAAITVESRVGNASAVRALVTGRWRGIEVPAARAWRVDLECIVAMRGQPVDWSSADIDVVLADAQRFGLRTLAERLFMSAGVDVTHSVVRVHLLGSMQVDLDGVRVAPPAGRAGELLKFLAVLDRTVPIDLVVDHLWPDAEFSRGRARLRNCVNRLRDRLGKQVVVRSGDTLALGPNVQTDLRDFWAAVAEIGSDRDARERALACFQGNLLESDLYTDWLMPEREAVRNAVRKILRAGLADGSMSAESIANVEHRLTPEG